MRTTGWVGVLVVVGLMLAGAAAPAPAAPAAPAARAPAPPASAARVRRPVGFMPVGTLNYIWTGDPARGCAAAGLCGVVGSLQVVTGNSSSGGGPGLPPIEIQDASAVARVQQSAADGAQSDCADPVPYDAQFVLRHRAAGRLRAVPQFPSPQPPSAGQCAGPTAGDLMSVALPARKLGRRGYDLSGTVSFGAGPFAVTVVSTIRALFVSQQGLGGPPFPPSSSTGPPVPRPRSALAERVDVAYRVIGVQGSLGASFSGLAEPFCTPLDACGRTGSVSLALRAPNHMTLQLSGSRLVRRRVGSRQALADLRAGRLRLDTNAFALQLGGELTGTLAGANAPTCRDTVSDSSLELDEGAARAGYRLSLDRTGPFPGFTGTDELRTRCPGPDSSEILGSRPLASGAVAVHAVGGRRLTIVLSASGGFRGGVYTGARTGSITLKLARSRISAGTRRVRIIGGQVIG